MNVKKLKELIKDLPDNTPVLRDGRDHTHITADVSVYKAVWSKKYDEWFEYNPRVELKEGDCAVEAVLIS